MPEGTAARFEVVPFAGGLGADVVGLDPAALDDAGAAALRSAWMRHSVLRLRGLDLDLDRLEAFSARFGTLDRAPITVTTGKPHLPDHPFVAVMSNIVVDGRPIGSLGAGEASWHTDMSYVDVVPMGSLLYAVEVPGDGGNTSFADMHRAYEGLPEALKRRIATLSCKHDASTNSAGGRRKGFEDVNDPRAVPGAVHPMVIRHPETGRRALYLGRRNLAYVVGLPLEESEALLDEVWAYATRPELVWTQQWRVGDMVMWDNRAVMHHRTPFDPASRRLMWRTQVQGPQPLAA